MAATETPPTNASVREIYRGPDFKAHYFVCQCGPADPVFEEAHEDACVAAVLSGFFSYKTDRSVASLAPGALLLGNKGQPYRCGHEHSTGDTSIVFAFRESMLETILQSERSELSSPRFGSPCIPPGPNTSTTIGRAQAAAASSDSLWLGEVAYCLAASALIQDASEDLQTPAFADGRRTADVIRYIEQNYSSPLTLAELADVARASPFHFLRIFRAVTGTTPYRYVVQMRLREAATRLIASDEAVTNIAFDVGFGDLSQFVRTFKNASGLSPGAFRHAKPRDFLKQFIAHQAQG